MPTAIAYFMLFGWPVVALILFRSLELSKALIWTMLGGYLLLPSAMAIKLPMIPAIDKGLVPTISAGILCLIFEQRNAHLPGAGATEAYSPRANGRWLIFALLLLLFVAPVMTVLNNPEPLIIGLRFIPELQIYDALSMISSMIVMILPFFLAWRYLNTREKHRQLLSAFVIAALIYSLPALFEVRMSPQLHNWIYGYFPHDFIQHIREGGFRPTVFLNHGLMIGILFCIAILSALALWREARREKKPALRWLLAAIWLFFTLYLSKSVGALAIAMMLGTIAALACQRIQVAFAALVAVIVLAYPAMRGHGWIPVDTIHEYARSITEDRAQSLKYRLDNEDALLAHANEKPLTGWGSWGRNQLYDPTTGSMISVTDGMWVILIGIYGWPGYIGHFALLTIPILLYARRRREFGPSMITPGLMIVLSAILIDLVPNSGLVPYVWMLAGALTGFVLRRTVYSVSPVVDPRPTPLQSWTREGAFRHGPPRPSWVPGRERALQQSGQKAFSIRHPAR